MKLFQKLFQKLFSKTLIVFLLLLVQFALILVTTAVFEVFQWFQLVSILIALCVFFHIVNKKECPEFKLPWLVLLFLLPLFTVSFYLIFANPRASKKDSLRLQMIEANTRQYTHKLDASDGDSRERSGIEKYLETVAGQRAHTANRVTYYKTGEEFWSDL
ncbi:MAG: PLDc N-terminal domain-containing protein, partial [Eubacteriales bacterium]